MKLLISLASIFIILFTATVVANAATTTTVTTVTNTVAKPTTEYKKHSHHKHCKPCAPCKKHYHHKKYYKVSNPAVRYYYEPGFCVKDPCACGKQTCYPGYYYQCRIEYSYRSGRNSAEVEVCH